MDRIFRLKTVAVLALACTALSVGSCGRKGDLDPPQGAVLKGTDKSGKPDVEDRPFVLDKLL